ncbi:MAG: hypothetical protein M1815_004353 [Lichina confinis]|nr:MAG: hypothetical protein M1815_004353 [Lichina confinis]
MTPRVAAADDRRLVEPTATTTTTTTTTTSSAVPLLAPEPSADEQPTGSASTAESEEDHVQGPRKPGKRRLLGLGRKRDHVAAVDDQRADSAPGQTSPPRAVSPASIPPTTSHPYQHAVAASYRHNRSPSPALPSPSSSFIFERDVQESVVPPPPSSAIPSHITREDYIPPVLEASSLAITDERLNPDNVQIVMHANHHLVAPKATATATTANATSGHGSVDASVSSLPYEPLSAIDRDAPTSSYGVGDVPDHRRLSFISFADVVQSEHMSVLPPTSSSSQPHPHAANRSSSPVHSGASSQLLENSPPTSGPTSVGGAEALAAVGGKGPASPTLGRISPPAAAAAAAGGELTIETMRQALRKTGSTDLGGVRSQPLSAASGEEFGHDVPWR